MNRVSRGHRSPLAPSRRRRCAGYQTLAPLGSRSRGQPVARLAQSPYSACTSPSRSRGPNREASLRGHVSAITASPTTARASASSVRWPAGSGGAPSSGAVKNTGCVAACGAVSPALTPTRSHLLSLAPPKLPGQEPDTVMPHASDGHPYSDQWPRDPGPIDRCSTSTWNHRHCARRPRRVNHLHFHLQSRRGGTQPRGIARDSVVEAPGVEVGSDECPLVPWSALSCPSHDDLGRFTVMQITPDVRFVPWNALSM